MLITADPASAHLAVFLNLTDPDGEVHYDLDTEWESGRLKTGARYATTVSSLNWPIIPTDADLLPGKWKAEVGVVNLDLEYTSDVEVDLDVLLKQDPDWESGLLEVDLVYVGAAAEDTELERAMGEAIDVWTDLYDQIGIDLALTERTWEVGAGGVAPPGLGSGELYEAISDSAPLGSVVVVVVDELEDGEGIYGVAGGIPGPLVGSERSVVSVNALTNSGPDLVFSEDEERLLGETMAHEVLHFLGLFHPVEPDWALWDALEDTPECDTQVSCVQALGENLMFPYPICGPTGCAPQYLLTAQQGGTANRYTGVE
jgi:hypothetical protein